jgi:hypothetical protein
MKIEGGIFRKGKRTTEYGVGDQERVMGGKYDQSKLCTCMKIS